MSSVSLPVSRTEKGSPLPVDPLPPSPSTGPQRTWNKGIVASSFKEWVFWIRYFRGGHRTLLPSNFSRPGIWGEDGEKVVRLS